MFGYYGLGWVYWERKELDKAIEQFNKVLAIDPEDADTYGCLARIYFEKRMYKQAVEYTDKALQLKATGLSPQFIERIDRYR